MSKHEKLLIGLALIPLALLGWLVWQRWQEKKRQAQLETVAEGITGAIRDYYAGR